MSPRAQNSDAIGVFISYSQRDLLAADRLVEALEEEGFKVTIDRRDLPYGEEWLLELTEFIAGSDTVVALVSPAFIASRACNWELGQVRATNKRLVPVVIEPVVIEDLPETIRKIQLLPAQGAFDFEAHLKPLAEVLNTDRQWIKEHTRLADRARQWISRGRPAALLLRGSALADAEAWQDRQPKAAPAPSEEILELMLASRRAATRRQRAIAAGSFFAAIVAFALAAAAAFQWRRAETSYAAARTNFDTLIKVLAAEMQNAEGMTAETVNRILSNGQELAANLKEASGGDARLEATRGSMFYQFGKTYQKINRRAEAIKASNESLEIWRRLSTAHPHNQSYAAGLAESLDLAGDLEREQRQFTKAREFYEQSVRIGSALNAKFPANVDYTVQLSKTLIRLGDLDRFDKKFAEAKERYAEAFEKTKAALRRTRSEPPIGLQRELTWNYNKIGDVSADLKDYAGADAAYKNGLCAREYLSSKDPGDTQLQHDISWSLSRIASVRLQTGDFSGALDAEFASLAIRRKLAETSDPKNRIWRRDLAASLHQIGEIDAKAGDYASAIAFFVAASEARLALKKDAPEDAAIAASFQASMTRAREARAKRLEQQADWTERPYREAVAEEEQAAAARARANARDPSVCFNAIIEGLRAKAAETRS
jgi:tetratricopeptide (TPR) repeat protein